MGSIRFSAASMFGSLSDVVGTKSGLALNRQQLCDLLGRDERFRKFQELGDDDWVRIHSTTAEQMIEFLLFSVGRLERINNPLPIVHLHHKYKADRSKLKVAYAISDEFDQINWRKFEGLTAEYFDKQGFRVDVGPGRNDDGVDVRVWPSSESPDSPPTIVVQCKRQRQSVAKVIVKSLYADVVHAEAKSGLIVTTSKLSPGAKAVCAARRYPIDEADRDSVRSWIAEMRKPGMGIAT